MTSATINAARPTETEDHEIDRILEARETFLTTPAADRSSLLAKLEILLADDDGHVRDWRHDLARQTLEDARRLL